DRGLDRQDRGRHPDIDEPLPGATPTCPRSRGGRAMTVHDLPHGRHTHERALELSATAVDFELSPAEAVELEALLAGCPKCAQRAVAMRADALALGRPLALVPSTRVDAAIAAEIA